MKRESINTKMIMITVFLCGILLVGIGAGVAFGEYSGFEYGGEKTLDIGKIETMTLEQKIATGKNANKTFVYNCYDSEYVVKEDKKVPEGMVRFEVSYYSDYISPELKYNKNVEMSESGIDSDELYLAYYQSANEMELFMEVKDDILSDLKNGKISSYSFSPVEKVVVKVNPKTMKYIE